MLEMLTKLCDCWGPSGCEQQVRDLIIDFAKPFSSDISTDPLGNLIIRKGTPGGRRIDGRRLTG
jgi:endoglucanase